MTVARVTTIGLAALGLSASPMGVIAQRAEQRIHSAASPGEASDVIVLGNRTRTIGTLSVTRAISGTFNNQIPRFETPICPVAIGLSPIAVTAIVGRVREVARQAGIRVDKPECRPNLTILIVSPAAAVIKGLHRKRPLIFSSLSAQESSKFFQSPGPVWAWKSISPKRRDGGPVEMISSLQIDGGPPQPTAKGAYIASNVQMSRLSSPVRQDIDAAFVVLEKTSIVGLTLGQIADYSALVGLAAIHAERVGTLGRPSILTMFEDAAAGLDAEPELTHFDRAYLSGLYSGESGYTLDQASAKIAQYIERWSAP